MVAGFLPSPDQTDIEVGRQYEASPAGRVFDESSQQVENCSTGDALPLKAIQLGRGFKCTDQSGIKVGRPRESSQIGQVVGQFQNVPFTWWNRKYIMLRTRTSITVMVIGRIDRK